MLYGWQVSKKRIDLWRASWHQWQYILYRRNNQMWRQQAWLCIVTSVFTILMSWKGMMYIHHSPHLLLSTITVILFGKFQLFVYDVFVIRELVHGKSRYYFFFLIVNSDIWWHYYVMTLVCGKSISKLVRAKTCAIHKLFPEKSVISQTCTLLQNK